ncbi:MAG: hypothetical protein DRO96_02235 [Candidatus Aenigmatarchaeota archaeon]|nr:MAG: hypothetical protein DRO96_02235 [Candidatus Aenigmarchaeota archaeon]
MPSLILIVMSIKNIFELRKKNLEFFRKPFGRLFVNHDKLVRYIKKKNPKKIITVGDISSINLIETELQPDIMIIDGKTKRKLLSKEALKKVKALIALRVKNPRGVISKNAWQTIKQALSYTIPVKIFVYGEEDLLVAPVTYFAPKGSIILYGLRGRGVVAVTVNEKKKRQIKKLLKVEEHPLVMIGGSWDRLHAGHRFILLTAFEHGKKVCIGITSKKFFEEKLRKKRQQNRGQDFSERKANVQNFLKEFNLAKRASFYVLNDMVGISLETNGVIVVSDETYPNALKINEMRKKNGKKPIKIIKIKRIPAQDKIAISSTRIRSKKIDRNGLIISKKRDEKQKRTNSC